MVEQDPVAGIDSVGLAVVYRYPVGVQLGHRIRGARIERRGLGLRNLLYLAVQFGGGGLVEAGSLLQTQDPDRLQKPEGSHGIGICRIFGRLERHLHMALRRQVVDLVRLYLLDYADQVGGVGQISIVEDEILVCYMGILIEVIDAIGIEQRGAPFDTVHDVVFAEQKLRQIGAILAGYPGY